MYQTRKLVRIALVVSLAGFSSTIYGQIKNAGIAPSAQPSQTPTNVVVVNSSIQPIPVGVNGTVPVRDVNTGTPLAVHNAMNVGFNNGVFFSYEVPAGKNLIVEYVSGRIVGAVASEHLRATMVTLFAANGGQIQRHFFVLSPIVTNDFTFSTPIKMYFGPGDIVGIGAERDAVGAAFNVEFQWGGRLVDAP